MKSTTELRALTQVELNTELLDLRKAQLKNRMMRANGVQNKQHEIVQIRRAIARIKTIMTEKAE